MAKSELFNPRRRPRLLRSHVPLGENLASIGILAVLAAVVAWVAAQRHQYDPTQREVAPELLLQASTGQALYNRPTQPWQEPGTALLPGDNRQNLAIDLAPFPAIVQDATWRPKRPTRRFNADNLFEKINGEAPKFLKQGFQALYYLVLRSTSGANEIAVELFDQSDAGGSLGVFSEHLSADKTIETQNGVTFFRTAVGAVGRVGSYFFRIAGDADNDSIRTKAIQLAIALGALATGATVPAATTNTAASAPAAPDSAANTTAKTTAMTDEVGLLQQAFDVDPTLLTYERQNVFQYDFMQNVWFGKRQQADLARLFVHRAASPAQAQALFDQLLEEQSYEYQVKQQAPQRALLWHEFLKNYFALQVRNEYLFGIENAADTDSGEAALQRFEQTLSENDNG